MLSQIRKKAASHLERGAVDRVICHILHEGLDTVKPAFLTSPEQTSEIVHSEKCTTNLAVYLAGKTALKGKSAIIADSATLRAIVMLIVESQLTREDLVILAIDDGGQAAFDIADEVYKADFSVKERDIAKAKELEDHRKLSRDERWKFWQDQFSSCIRCYACRQACPMCYCERCIVEKNQPQWVPTSIHDYGNFVWNLTRAYHLSGRCVSCYACDNACPAGIPLQLLNQHLSNIAEEKFDWKAGMDTEKKPPFMTADIDDSVDFIE